MKEIGSMWLQKKEQFFFMLVICLNDGVEDDIPLQWADFDSHLLVNYFGQMFLAT